MKRVFSFIEKPVPFILQLLPSILPGIEKIITVYYSPDINRITSEIIKKKGEDNEYSSFQVSDSTSVFDHLRSENSSYSWLRKEDLPFEVRPEERVQLEIFNELNNNVLLIRIFNLSDSKNDLFFIYFNKDLSNFGTINPNKILSTENKTIIGHILRNSIMAFIKNYNRDKDLFATLNENTRAMIRERNLLRNELEVTREKYKEGLIRLSNSYLEDLNLITGIRYRFTESAVKKISEYSGDIDNLKPVIGQAAHYAETMNLEGNANNVLIDDFHLVIDVKKESPQKESIIAPIQDIPVKYNKTFLLLEKLENAAIHVKSKNQLLTGANIGNEFPTPVTPPAITDALKKHKQKILFLFHEYPDRWKTIRIEFRPVQNLLNAKPFNEQLSA
jgi:hypothetical protein